MKTLLQYLNKYYDFQDKILLVYRSTEKSDWATRCFFLEEGFSTATPYNHRVILKEEIVIEFDGKDTEKNKTDALAVVKRLRADNIKCSVWSSGNRSVHVHFFIETNTAGNISLLKNTVMKYYTKDIAEPDYRLASDNHLIRAEFGVHEKTQRKKTLISEDKGYPIKCVLKDEIWSQYVSLATKKVSHQMYRDLNNITQLKGFQYIINTVEFRASDDGRERALFMIIHVLKGKYKDNKEEFIRYVSDWYRYSGGTQLSQRDIINKVNYHWKKEYTIGRRYLNELLQSIGRSDLIDKVMSEV